MALGDACFTEYIWHLFSGMASTAIELPEGIRRYLIFNEEQ